MANRGTKRSKLLPKVDNWSGKKFKEYMKKKLQQLPDDATISIGRGTQKVKVKDLKKKKGTDRAKASKGKYVSTGRGTGRRKL